jgi:glycerol-3-phosphate acyltransferase PlsX
MTADPTQCTIAVDAMGGDLGPQEVVAGLAEALAEQSQTTSFRLVGDEPLLLSLLQQAGLKNHPKVSILHASEVIGMDEKPVQSIKQKRDASMVRAIELAKSGEVQAVVSCGNTGALMACSTLRLRQIPGIDRPALASIVPGRRLPFVLLDVGANPESTPEHLVHNAILGSNYARTVLNIHTPRVGLLSIGTEESKGNNRTLITHSHLKNLQPLIDYRGPIEGFQVFNDIVDVVICDGFVGNVVLKVSEALFGFIGDTLKEELVRNPKRKLGAVLSRSAYRDMKRKLNPDQYSGAPLLGLNGNVLKAHGSSNRHAIAGALRVAREIIIHDMIESITREIAQANANLNSNRMSAEE